MTVSVLLVDDHAIFRKSVRTLLQATTNFQIVGEAGDGREAVEMLDKTRPDVVVLDCVMPHMSGLEIALRLKKQKSATRVVMLSMHSEEDYVTASIQNGAYGYILKEDIVTHLAKAIQAARANSYYLSPALRDLMTLPETE
jgi:DNA-binding NarL/FixJ family response regulator